MTNLSPYHRINDQGEDEYSDGDTWFAERYLCHRCAPEREAANRPYRFADEQYSYGIYAGRYCDQCAYDTFADHCGIDGPQGDPTTLAEFEAGGWDAITGEDL